MEKDRRLGDAAFPAFVKRLPEADLPFPGLRGWMLRGGEGLTIFFEAAEEVVVPEHAHGDQWGFVVTGEITLTMGGVTRTCKPGDEYVVPAGMPHRALLGRGARAVDFFTDPERYRVKRQPRRGG